MTIEYNEMVEALVKPGQDIIDSLTPIRAHVLHMAVGISGESGELLDAIKKHVIYGKPLDMENVIEELGDIEFYMEGIRQGLGVTREETLVHNIAKLGERYKGLAYSDKAAIDREDKTVPVVHTLAEMSEAVDVTGIAKLVNGEMIPVAGIGVPL